MASNQYLIFKVDEEYAIDVAKVQEIVELKEITKVPETPPYIFGVINLRNHVYPVVDIRTRFKKEPSDQYTRKTVVIIDFEGVRLGLIVDTVVDLAVIGPEDISDPPQVGNDYAHVFIKAIGLYEGKIKLIVDTDKLVNLSDLAFDDPSENAEETE